jgi:hypothetical protein
MWIKASFAALYLSITGNVVVDEHQQPIDENAV